MFNKIAAGVLDFFKAKTPKVYSIVVLGIGTLQYLITQGQMEEWFGENELYVKIAQWIAFASLAVGGSRTTRYVKKTGTLERK